MIVYEDKIHLMTNVKDIVTCSQFLKKVKFII